MRLLRVLRSFRLDSPDRVSWLMVVLVMALALGACRNVPETPSPGAPRLVLVVAIDQLMADRLDPDLPGGLGRIAREGRVFTQAAHLHARSETCPGHAVMFTGVHPGRAGIPGNRFIVAPSGGDGAETRPEVRYCVQDDTPEGVLLTSAGPVDTQVLDAMVATGRGRSPRQLRVSALGDWMKARWPEARVFSVSAKDRAAIVMGGQRPDAAYWLDRAGSGSFTTSRYYLEVLPDWAQAWTRERVLAGLPEAWDYRWNGEAIEFDARMRVDDYAHESDRFSRTEPHPLVVRGERPPSISPVEASPYLDTRTLAFVEDLVAHERVGEDAVPDLLAVSLSGTDIVGHHFGPRSREARAALVALDHELAGFLSRLESRVGAGRLFVVLTSDHGVLPIPEWWQTHGGANAPCPVAGGRISPEGIDAVIAQTWSEAVGGDVGPVRDGLTVGFDRGHAQRAGVDMAAIIATSKARLEALPGIDRVWTRTELEAPAGDGDPLETLYRNHLAPDRGGDLFMQPTRGCLFTGWPSGTSHGSPHDYDLDVPLVFWGDGVDAALVPGPAAPVDLAPTLAAWLGLEPPADLDGRVLSLGVRP